ncbi:kinase-like protein [Rhizophagus irregularis]|uniref:Kinase-like protein n=1 Tax=Rhizophagus irregularis TaxID=588596 RepID=A0A2I1H873_9GLOM|nr:kinase-like protein [Rhizophagus irregularis]
MQYANDGDLQSYLKENFKNLTWNDKKKLAFQIADGLNCLHNENILHRDLHSKNIVIHENNAKITDFGISKNQNDQTSTAYIGNFGIVAYMEPNRFTDPKFPYTKSSDIYSFGVLMWEISSGYPPFKDNDNKIALAISINTGIREVTIPGTPNEYEKLYKNCWNQVPEERPTINKILDEFIKMGFGNIATSNLVKGIIFILFLYHCLSILII